MATTLNNSNRKRKWIFLGIGLLTAGLSLFGYNYWKKNKQKTSGDSSAPDFKAEKPKAAPNTVKPKQQKPASPKKPSPPAKKQVPQKVTKPDSGGKTTANNPNKVIDGKTLAQGFHAAIQKKDFSRTYTLLRNIRNTKDYSAVSKPYSTLSKQTLVTGLLNAFRDVKQRETLNKSFRAIGLKYNDKTKKWALSGVGPTLIITTTPTKVWKDPKTAVPVPVNMVLGQQVCQRGNFTLFESDRQYFLVETRTIKAYNS